MATGPIGESLPGPEVVDLMNDPLYATNTGSGEDGTGDGDTCRICRGEATEQEPLFYPCKCSGSIKFVHQDCLMEWLSHSQKKHCELCKTPFRFTKLYSPNMPQSLPNHVFLQHLAIHTVKNLAIWLRFCLVVLVWLGCLPWAMRHIWGFLFWFGDGGWTSKSGSDQNYNKTTQVFQAAAKAHSDIAGLILNMTVGISPASPLMTSSTTPKSVGTILNHLPDLIKPIFQILNISSHETFPADFFRAIYTNLSLSPPEVLINTIGANATEIPLSVYNLQSAIGRSSLLSEVRLLKELTRWPRLNGIIITALEGQVITIVVVVCFILVFLIREWVVQQQPGINMGAGFNADFGGERAARNRILPDNAPGVDVIPVAADRDGDGLHDLIQRQAMEVVARPIAQPRRRAVRFEDGTGNIAVPRTGQEHSTSSHLQERDAGEGSAEAHQQRPGMLARDALSPAAEIQRQLAEDSSKLGDQFDAGEFVSVWRRAGGSPEEVLRIIDEEGLSEKLRYWKNAMKGLQANSGPNSQDEQKKLGGQSSLHDSTDSLPVQLSDGTNSTNESWVDVPASKAISEANVNPSEEQENQPVKAQSGKGKEKLADIPLSDASNGISTGIDQNGTRLVHIDEGPSWADLHEAVGFQSGPGRPRAVSDGPQPRETISPLAENYWSFSNLHDPYPTGSAQESPSRSSPEKYEMNNSHPDTTEDEITSNASLLQDPQAPIITTSEESGPASHDSADRVEIYNQKNGSIQIANSWDDIFTNNPVSDSENSSDDSPGTGNEQNPFHPDGLLPDNLPLLAENRDLAPQRHPEPQGMLGHVADFLWGDLNVIQDVRIGDDEHIVQDIAAEAPFVPVAHHHGHGIFDDDDSDDEGEADQDRDVLAAALAAGIDPNDPDGLDDVEDFEGIMELVGMRGPLTALVQNAIFSAVLISLTVACGVWVPYNVGRLVLLLIANPIATIKLPLKFVFGFAAVLQDLAVVLLGSLTYLVINICSMPKFIYSYMMANPSSTMTDSSGPAFESIRFAKAAGERISDGLVGAILQIPKSEVPAFSAVSHESLLFIKALVLNSLRLVGSFITSALADPTPESSTVKSIDFAALWTTVSEFAMRVWYKMQALPTFITTGESWVITLDMPERVLPVDPSLSHWGGTDRFWAILAGYVAFSFLGAAYLRKGSPFSTSQTGREWEATIIDVLNQAGGVMKVILIISIEMLVFPLYCGLLLDIALLPLFENATILSRVLFTMESPLTSIFVHWFVGTCYMFHFALFVSMCRKIMRSGVLYFIRDPDDPTFHPVRDVLERNVSTQLRKITFSAMVYGALVVICLGGVVWGLAFAFDGVLPIHWSSNEPVLEFPIDLLFYNFFMPLAVKFFKPSDGLHAMYTWWFRKCARMLRLTWFLFDKKMPDEEGHHVRRNLGGFLLGFYGDTKNPVSAENITDLFQDNPHIRAYFQRDGRYVRAPASDQVRIPKGGQVFLEVDENNNRIDRRLDSDDGPHGRASKLFKMIYIPPYFRGRIFLFILFIWLFAAVTGVCITVVPLVFGRQIFARIIPAHVQKNDVYAFSIGIYILGSTLYCIMHARQGFEFVRKFMAIDADTPAKIFRKVSSVGLRAIRVIYTYSAFALVLPLLLALAVELYFIVPLHTYFAVTEPHVIHFVQSWTLGLLYVKLTTRLILWHNDSRPAEALRAVTQRGYLDPDIRIATRAFILPATTALITALLVPYSLASIVNRHDILGSDIERQTLVYRYAYPFCLSLVINTIGAWFLIGVMMGWRMRIRDEVYLIGERLHNFGDRSKSGTTALVPQRNRIETGQ